LNGWHVGLIAMFFGVPVVLAIFALFAEED
jgi:hypothetical protein